MVERRSILRAMGWAGLGLLLERSGLVGAALDGSDALTAFEEVASAASGVSWSHVAGQSPDMYLPETVGSGCAFLDYDNDGWMDIYLVNSGPSDFYKPPKLLRNALYRNNRNGTFTDVTLPAGVPGNAYGMGVAVGDYDGDGFPDLFVTQYPKSILYHNNGDGTFTDVTDRAGVACPGWASSAVWFDYDNDGRLDLFVCRFVEFSKATNRNCGVGVQNHRAYCSPALFPPAPCWLYHNNGDGTFTDVSKESGIAKYLAKGWGVVAADINNDGWVDLFVSNDTAPNFLFINRGKGRFEENAALAGVGYSSLGKARSGMGVDAADYDQDGWADLFVSNIDHESYSLYHNAGEESFSDAANAAGLAAASWLLSGWGAKFFDYDNDGNLDLLLANGHPDLMIQQQFENVSYPEPMLL
ncbi:MAG TPA: VCBS repeat-containing protein, partial [Terriglobales bacterium]